MTPIKLQTVRPFYFDVISLSDYRSELEPTDTEQIGVFLANKVEELINTDNGEPASDLLPLVRLCVNYTGGFQTIHPSRFGQRFVGRVANPDSILRFTRQSARAARDRNLNDLLRDNDMLEDFALHAAPSGAERQDEQAVGSLIRRFLSSGMKPLESLSPDELTAALTDFVDKGDTKAFGEFLQGNIKATCDFLSELEPQKTLTEGDVQSLITERMKAMTLDVVDDGNSSEAEHSCCDSPPQSPIRYDDEPAERAGSFGGDEDYDEGDFVESFVAKQKPQALLTPQPASTVLPILRQTKSAPTVHHPASSAKRAKPTLAFLKSDSQSEEESSPLPVIKRQRKQTTTSSSSSSSFARFESQDSYSDSPSTGTSTQSSVARRNAWGTRRQ